MNQQNEEIKEMIYEQLDEKLEIPTYLRDKMREDNLDAQDLVDEFSSAVELTNKKVWK